MEISIPKGKNEHHLEYNHNFKVISFTGDQDPAEQCDQELAFPTWHENAQHWSAATLNLQFRVPVHIYRYLSHVSVLESNILWPRFFRLSHE